MANDWPIIRTGVDEKGWNTMDFNPASGARSRMMRVGRWGRKLEIFLQDKPLRVHVNPTVGGLDQWEYPLDSGNYMWIRSPLEPLAEHEWNKYLEELKELQPPEVKKKAEEEFRKGKEQEALPPPDGAASAGCEKESEGDGIPAAKKQKTSWLAPGAASSKEPDPDEHTPQKAGGYGNTAHEKLCITQLPDWSIVKEESRSLWRVRTDRGWKCFSYKHCGMTEDEASGAASCYMQRALYMREIAEIV